MDVNGSRHHTLTSRDDWLGCLSSAGDDRQLEWRSGALALRAQLFEFRAQRPEAPAGDEETGRGGVFDAYGNLYAISADRRGLRIRSAGSGEVSDFWPIADSTDGDTQLAGSGEIEGYRPGTGVSSGGFFRPLTPAIRQPDSPRLDAISITRAHYLVAASREAGGLLIFDLHGAGPPLFQPWPGLGTAEALVALADGSVGALVGSRLLRSAPDLRPLVADDRRPPAFAETLPEDGASSPPVAPESPPTGDRPCELDLRPALPDDADAEATALAVLPGDRLLVLGQLNGQPGRVWLGAVDLDGRPIAVSAGDEDGGSPPGTGTSIVALNPLIGAVAVDRRDPTLASRALAIDWGPKTAAAKDGDAPFSIVVVGATGDQAYRFAARWHDGGLVVGVVGEYLPMRRYQAMGLAALPAGARLHAYPDSRVFYATGGRWAPLLGLAQPRFVRAATLTTPAWDSGIPGCVWHRLTIDLRLPPGTSLSVDTRSGETPEDLRRAEWRSEPALLRSARGSELAWRASGEAPDGTWEVLLQAAHGRWFQARLQIGGDGRQTPLLRALRVWYPRFSYAREYLPPVFRADRSSADFLDRLLALFEGEFTRWEERIAAAQWLFDARTAPRESLEWLAGWLGLAFDPAADETRRRLLIRHAMLGHARRGTVPGILLGATLAWEATVEEDWLRHPEALAERPHGLRLHELFALDAPLPAGVWRPAEGRAALLAAQRLAGEPRLADPGELAAAGVAGAAEFAAAHPERRAQLLGALGFIPRAALEESRLWAAWSDAAGSDGRPALPEDEPADAAAWTRYLAASEPCAPLRQRWQDFLARRWRRVSALNAAWGSRWRSFARIPSPVVVPAPEAALGDWHRFEAQVLRALANAHRFRVVLPLPDGDLDLDDLARRRAAVLRVVDREKPAHTTAEVRFGFDLFRVGEARLGLDTRLEAGLARRPELAALAFGSGPFAPAVLGRTDLGGARLAPARPQPPADRIGLDRG